MRIWKLTIHLRLKPSQEVLDEIYADLEEEYNRTIVNRVDAILVGVIMAETCGGHPRLTIRMNTEKQNNNDGGNALHAVSFFADSYGNCYIPFGPTYHAQYVSMSFCVIDGGEFQRWEHDYALLKLSNNVPSGVQHIYRVHDNENDPCTAAHGIWYQGEREEDDAYGGNYVTRDGLSMLQFYYFDKDPDCPFTNPWPEWIDFQYAVFGRFGNVQGYLHVDDEDTDNANRFYPDHGYNPYINIFDVGDADKNTTYFFSLVGEYCGH